MNTAKLSKKDRLESRPQGILPTPLDPASPQARAHEWEDPAPGPCGELMEVARACRCDLYPIRGAGYNLYFTPLFCRAARNSSASSQVGSLSAFATRRATSKENSSSRG
jgi:hypothetical protein